MRPVRWYRASITLHRRTNGSRLIQRGAVPFSASVVAQLIALRIAQFLDFFAERETDTFPGADRLV